ncbi:Receptor-type tyrosine-protein kinase FLT3 [Dissostichus eleginoides]|uniref:receptor protein-tyrosine kinase n=1 Tax=Dissostichus eleginoides TaxID=100907 RepID=A0AAD9BJA9_DISEL|nr:Receptor-type tyrosine-protein kinase FLT3 [Dissostichus eleginoides]
MIAGIVVLCAVRLLCSDGVAAQSQACVPNHEVECFVPADHLNASGSVSVEVCVGKKLIISLQHFSEHPVCSWIRGADTVITVNGSESLVLRKLSEDDSGEHTLRCETSDGASSSMNVSLKVAMQRPSKPKLTIDKDTIRFKSPSLTCISEDCPEPTLKWTGNQDGTVVSANSGRAQSRVSTSGYSERGVMCCATNARGQECSQLYDYDLDSEFMKDDEVSNVTVSPVKREICIKSDSHEGSWMHYLFIESANSDHSGTYTCRTPNNKTKSVNIQVQAEGFLSVQLNKSKILPAHDASTSCLQASVSYHPVLEKCSWETPDKTEIECKKNTWVTKHRTVMLCVTLKSGDYKLHMEAGGLKETKTISVCVVDPPKFRFENINNTFTFETVALVPANYTWKSCVLSNDSSCETESNWNEIPGASHTDSDVSCQKTIRSSLSRSLVNGNNLWFCLTNSLGSLCKNRYIIENPHTQMSSRVVSVVLIYFVKKKKPQYQPQLQMIQMVGPNDNDYIYINFKDFGYDKQWEFPRENLELEKRSRTGLWAFGTVVQATAYGINEAGVSQQVAVKMLKEKHQTVEKEALMSELKMLTHIGHHANIVNLLGACTDSGPTYLIFQYCCYGDLLNYLKTNRELYHKSVTDAFTKDRFSSIYHNLQPNKSSREGDKAVDNYVPMHRSTTGGQEDIALLHINLNDSIEEPLNNEEADDLTDDEQTLTFDDLLSFAFQVAKGMEFLSSKNVRLPVKWMAPESTFQGIYTMKSDVWAYGILLWEIFSLGVTPYPGMKVDHTFYSMIERGFKMECPYYANESVYGMMCKCWALDPCDRPSFSKLVSFVCDQLTDREEQLYHNMPDQESSIYQNAATILDISALTQQNENKAANDYCRTHATEESKAEVSETVAAEEKLKTSDAE